MPTQTTVGVPLVSDRVWVVLTLVVAAVLVLSVVVALLVWHTPALHPVAVPSVAQA